jgi:hypothetical protein
MHNLELMESLSLLFMMKVMALHFVDDFYKVTTNSSSYYLHIIVLDIDCNFIDIMTPTLVTIGVHKGYV